MTALTPCLHAHAAKRNNRVSNESQTVPQSATPLTNLLAKPLLIQTHITCTLV